MPIEMPKTNPYMMQECPLCSEIQPVYVAGHARFLEDPNKMVVTQDRGYSFCNCYNIFYTNWNNMKEDIYDSNYKDIYQSNIVRYAYDNALDVYLPKFKELMPYASTILEVGSINHYMLDKFKEAGYETYGLDVIEQESENHHIYHGNFEELDLPTFDIIYMSHVFEHFKNPIKARDQLEKILNFNGLLFIAMPDPFFIDWNDIYSWGHWHVNEHHILWDMESFIDFMTEFKCVYKYRNPGNEHISNNDYHLIFRRK